MAAKKTAYPKLTRPDVTGISPRTRLLELLEDVNQAVIWISSPGGSGKTTLAASYLDVYKRPCLWYQMDEGDVDPATFFHYMSIAAKMASSGKVPSLPAMTPEYLQHGVSFFAKKYFENLYRRLVSKRSGNNRPFFIVFDNYQDVHPEAELHEIIASGLSLLPQGIKVIILSRNEPPPSFARHRASRSIRFIGWDDVRFTFEESKAIISPELQQGLIDKALRDVHEKAQGWAAGMILMLEKSRLEGAGVDSTDDIASEGIFDYFAGEIFDKTEKDVRIFLLKTAFLPGISITTAEKMTGLNNAGNILSTLNRHHFFTERLSGTGQDYKYHPMFRAFLLNRAQIEFSRDELAAVKKGAAVFLEKSGRLEDAARLYSEAGDPENLVRTVINHSRKFLMQGRNKIIEEWIACIPVEMANENPWLSYWNGMCSFPYDMPRTREYLEKAFEAFSKIEDTSGIYLSWAGIVDTYAFELDEWKHLDRYIEILDDLLKKYPSCPSAEIDLIVSSRMLISLTLRKTDHTEWVNDWYSRVTALLQEKPSPDIMMDTVFCMSVYYLWTGEYNKNAILLERADAEIKYKKTSSFAAIRIKLMKGIHCWVTAKYDSALGSLSQGLDISNKSGVHVFDSLLWSFRAASEMAQGHMDTAGDSLKKQLASLLDTSKTLDIFFYHINSAWHAMLAGNPSLAAENMFAISAKVERIGTPYYAALWNIGMAQISFFQGDHEEAKALIEAAHDISRGMRSHVMEWYSLLIKAYFFHKKGDDISALDSLRQGLSLGRRYGYVHLEFYQPQIMQSLCSIAMKENMELEYVTEIIGKLRLNPPNSVRMPDEWTWPLKIFTLGRFEIIKDGNPLIFSGKEPKKSLEMLKSIIAFGGKNVPEEHLADAMWPDADGDLAHKSFETTLGRLRRLLGGEHFIRCSAGQLSLDTSCWVDSIAIADIFPEIRKSPASQIIHLAEKAVALYQGDFLPSDNSLSWTLYRREMLKSNQLRIIVAAGRSCEQKKLWENATDYYLCGLNTDNLAEELYQRLMVCYQKLDKKADAVRTYMRCRSTLQEKLGILPSSATEDLYISITRKK